MSKTQKVQTTVYLEPYHVAGIQAVAEKRTKLGRNTAGLQAELFRTGLEKVFEDEGITDEKILEILNRKE